MNLPMTLPKSCWSIERSKRREGDPFLDQNLLTGTPHTAAHRIPIQNLALGPDHHAHILDHYPAHVLDPARVPGHAPSHVHRTPAEAEVGVAAFGLDHGVRRTIVLGADHHHIGLEM